jgi:hypothetical protein
MKAVDERRIAQALLALLDDVPEVERERELAGVISSNCALQLRLAIALDLIADRQDS